MQAFYTTHGRMISPGRHKALLDGLPSGIGALSRVTQGLLAETYESDDRLRVPGTVFNAVRGRAEDVAPDEPVRSAGSSAGRC